MIGWEESALSAISSAAVFPVAAKCSLFWMVWKNTRSNPFRNLDLERSV
jgi:hypothetical protein